MTTGSLPIDEIRVLSEKDVPLGTSFEEKHLDRSGGGSGAAGILRKSSLTATIPFFHKNTQSSYFLYDSLRFLQKKSNSASL